MTSAAWYGARPMELGYDEEELRRRAFEVVRACSGAHGVLAAAAGSALYPHVWARDVGYASLGILAAARGDEDVDVVVRSLQLLARHQDALGRIPLKVDASEDRSVAENAAGIDCGMWFVIAVDALASTRADAVNEDLIDAALRALEWTLHLDVNGCGLLESPEASDWADMMPNRHNVLFANVLFVAALRAGARLERRLELSSPMEIGRADDAMVGAAAEVWSRRAAEVAHKVNLLFGLERVCDARSAAEWITALEAAFFEWGLTGQYASRWGDLPFYLPYVGFRVAGRHCDVVGNLLAILTQVASAARASRIVDYLDAVGAAEPFPTKTSYPPLVPGDADFRDHFLWRNLNVPDHYQNGGIWPFTGGLHVAALVHADRAPQAKRLCASLARACVGDAAAPFPEWMHGRTGRSMGEINQLWSATGLLYALETLRRGKAPFLSETI